MHDSLCLPQISLRTFVITSQLSDILDQERDSRYGWVMVGVTFVLTALSFGAATSITVFIKPLSEEFGWGRSETALGYTTVAFASASFGVLWGYIADKMGTRWFGLIAAIFMSSCLYLLSNQSSLWQFYALYFVFGAFGNALVSSPLFANVGFWFRKNPGLALGITASGGAVGQGVVPFCVGMAISAYGWQQAYVLMAISYFIVALPIAFLIRESPTREKARLVPLSSKSDFSLSEIEVVIWVSCAAIFCCNCMSVPIVHLVPLLMDAGKDPQVATSVLLVLMLAGGVGRIAGGKICDMIGAVPGYMLMSLGQTFFVFWFPHFTGLTSLYILAVLFGLTYSGVMSSILVCNRTMVSAGFSGRAMSITAFFGWIGMGMGGYFGGLFYDIYGDYFWSYAFASTAGIVNLVILALFYFRIKAQKRAVSLFSKTVVA